MYRIADPLMSEYSIDCLCLSMWNILNPLKGTSVNWLHFVIQV